MEVHSMLHMTAMKVEKDVYKRQLSGNVREKLRIAQSAQNLFEGDYAGNVEALKAAQPKDLDASEIEVRLGATWIDPSYIRELSLINI